MASPPADEWLQGNSSGSHLAPVTKLLLHTTEGTSIEGACGAYRTNNSWPHVTVDCLYGHRYRRCGHLDLDVAARSLRNLSGGVETNRAGVIQIEIVGFAQHPSDIDWPWLGANLVGPICGQEGIPLASNVMWVSYPDSYGQSAPQRLSPSAWTAYAGVLGHQHCPENDHGDPGAIPIGTLLAAANPPPIPTPVPLPDLEVPMEGIIYNPGDDTTWWFNTEKRYAFRVSPTQDDLSKLSANDDVNIWTNLSADFATGFISGLTEPTV